MKKTGKTARTKGHNAEREYVKIFRELGYKDCITSRLGSRMLDNAGIDLMYTPFNVQIKAGYKSLNYRKELTSLQEKREEHLVSSSPEKNFPTIIIHRKDMVEGKKRRTEFDDLVCMTFKDFEKIIKTIKDE